MNNALHGREAWRGPYERDRGRQGAAGSRVLETGVFGLRRSLAGCSATRRRRGPRFSSDPRDTTQTRISIAPERQRVPLVARS